MSLAPNNCSPQLNESEQLLVNAIGIVNKQVIEWINLAWKYETMGRKKDAECVYNWVANVYYFIWLLFIIKNDVTLKYKIGDCPKKGYLNEKYKLDCIIDNLQCQGLCNIEDLLNLFGINENLDGIGWMAITEGCEIFQVDKNLWDGA